MKNGAPIERGDDADLDLLRPGDHAADHVGRDEQGRAGHARRTAAASGGRCRPAAGTGAGRPVRRTRSVRRPRSPRRRARPRPTAAISRVRRDVLAEPGGEVVAEGEGVHARAPMARQIRAPTTRNGSTSADRGPRSRRRRRRSARSGTSSMTSTRGSRMALTSERERRRGRRAGQRELERGRAAAAERADDVDEDGGHRRARRWPRP